MPRILFDARSTVEKTGGVSRVAERVLTHIRQTRPDAEIVTITTGFIDARVTTDRVHSLHKKWPNKLWSLACLLGITSLDRVATKMSGTSFDELILPNVGFVGLPTIPYTIVVHDLSFLIEPKWFPWKMRVWHRAVGASRLIKNATNIWCVSETTARDVEQLLGVERRRITVLPHGIIVGATHASPLHEPLGSERASANDETPHPYVLAFGGNNPRKNVATAIAAVDRIKEDERFRDVKLIIVGRDVHPSDEELDRLYANASALLYPSWYEGFGLPLHEAARACPERSRGIPILASAHGALPETAPLGTILINPAKPHLWIEALRNALEKTFVKQ